jgi:ketol-acid reductoisomerase
MGDLKKDDRNFLIKRGVTVLGYGSQGRAQALNLNDSGVTPLIGLPSKSRSRKLATADCLAVATPTKAIAAAGIIAVLIPDHKHREFFDSLPESASLSKKALIFAHGLSVAFGLVKPPSDCDLIMVAPHGPGVMIRERYLGGEPFTAFAAVKQDFSGQAWRIARSYAAAIGCRSGNLFISDFRDEAVGDIFGEQAVLVGGLTGLLEAGFKTLVENGHSRQSAYLECVHQLDLLVDLIKRFGPAGMFERISKTAAYGSMNAKKTLFDSRFSRRLDRLYSKIDSGKFAVDLAKENKRSMADFKKLLAAERESLLQKTHHNIAKRLGDLSKTNDHRKRNRI